MSLYYLHTLEIRGNYQQTSEVMTLTKYKKDILMAVISSGLPGGYKAAAKNILAGRDPSGGAVSTNCALLTYIKQLRALRK